MDNLEITEIQYGPFLQYLKRDDITDVDFNGRDLWIRDVNVGRVKVTDQDVVEQLTENFIESFTAAVSNMLGENLTATNPTLEAETGNYRYLYQENTSGTKDQARQSNSGTLLRRKSAASFSKLRKSKIEYGILRRTGCWKDRMCKIFDNIYSGRRESYHSRGHIGAALS